jgi:hypothetical protein
MLMFGLFSKRFTMIPNRLDKRTSPKRAPLNSAAKLSDMPDLQVTDVDSVVHQSLDQQLPANPYAPKHAKDWQNPAEPPQATPAPCQRLVWNDEPLGHGRRFRLRKVSSGCRVTVRVFKTPKPPLQAILAHCFLGGEKSRQRQKDGGRKKGGT